jgi:hypothetical protein
MALSVMLTPKTTFALSSQEGLTISPPTVEISIKANSWVEETIRVTNSTNRFITVSPMVMDFRADGENGDPDFYKSEVGSYYTLSRWISYDQSSLNFSPGQMINFKYIIYAPVAAEPGGHYGALFFVDKSAANISNRNVAVNSMIGQLIFVSVPGKITKKAILKNYSSLHSVYFKNNFNYLVKIKDEGNIHIIPSGSVVLTDLIGQKVASTSINPTGGLILPTSIRKFELNYSSKKILIGPYKATLTANYGSSKPLTSSLVIFILPGWFLVGLAILVILILYIYKHRTFLKNIGQKIAKYPRKI